MRLDTTPAERFLSYADGDRSLADVWNHPAYDVARNHAELLGRDLDREDVEAALQGEDTAFGLVSNLTDNRGRVAALLEQVGTREAEWQDHIERYLTRVTPDEDVSSVTVYLAIGYEFGIGNRDGVFINLNEPLFFDDPRQLLYTAIHESSHVLYDRVHDFTDELGPEDIADPEGQRRVFATLMHTEAYATYTPLTLRRDEGNLGTHDHPVCADYRVLGDETRLRELVAEYDTFRERVRTDHVSAETLLTRMFAESRLPYRVGCAILDRLERTRGIEAVREAFYLDPAAFLEEYDGLLDAYRTNA